MTSEVATFGAGCFWGVEAAFRKLDGVLKTEVGYEGGDFESPTYEDVCSKTTGHAEVVRVEFDAEKIAYEDLLRVFWECHDPTQYHRQGPDVGSQYRSVIFYHSDIQRDQAESSRQLLTKHRVYSDPIVTEVVPAQVFYRAEEYHQQYFEKKGITSCGI